MIYFGKIVGVLAILMSILAISTIIIILVIQRKKCNCIEGYISLILLEIIQFILGIIILIKN